MRLLIVAAWLSLVAGCGSGGSETFPPPPINHGYGMAFDVQGASGLKLRYTPILTTADPMSNPIFLENIFQQVEACTGITAPAPFVIYVQSGTLHAPDGNTPWVGETITNPMLVLVHGDDLTVIRHEFIHVVLDGDPEHKSPFFKSRADGGCA